MSQSCILFLCIIDQDIKEQEVEEDAHFAQVLASFRFIRCNFKKHARPELYIYESLSQKPSPNICINLFLMLCN